MELFDMLDGPYRTERMMESIDTILKLLSSDPPYNINGKHWKIRLSATVMPELGVGFIHEPLQQPQPPIMMTAMSPFSDSMVIHGSPKTVTEKLLSCRERTGPFGGLLMAMMDGSGTNRAREFESMTLLAREVMPAVRSALGR